MHLAVLVELRQEYLRDDGLQSGRELGPHLLLLVRRERVDDTVDRLRRARRVQRAEDEVARLGRGDRGSDRLEVAHFADEDHVRVLSQRAADRLREARHVVPDLALGDERLRGRVVEFDRVLDGDDVHAALVVDDVQHRGERRRLAGAGRAGHEDEPARLEEKLLHRGRDADLLKREKSRGDLAENRAVALALLEHGHAEARAVGVRKREVSAAVLLDLLHLLVGGDLAHEVVRVLLRKRLLRKRAKLAVHAQLGRHVRADVEVRAPLVDRRLQQFAHVYVHKTPFSSSPFQLFKLSTPVSPRRPS